ncbi:MAG TPA: sigma factor-like helix-turn-helix DNA-binding protein, partial [Conexibacter sp.]|nr:sigma factor-like helix-turn-helix DNA-binding protein [Conexibacter sp.]
MTVAARERPGARATQSTYEHDRAHVLAVLARRCGWLDHGEREAIFHDAYLVLLQKQHDGAIDLTAMNEHQTRAYLVQTALHKALDEGKRAGRARERSLDADLDAGLEPADAAAAPDEQAVSRQTSVQVREIVAELPERQQTIVKLRFFFDRAPEEIQRFLGLSERVYRRELERAMRELSAGVELVRDGAFCESRRSAILALIAGIAGPNRARDARDHLASCPACARWAVAVRDSTREAAAVLPLPALALATSEHRLGRLWESVRETFSGSTSSAKQHVTETATRLDAASAGYATSLRPGALAAAAAGCLALGGGATYCAV